MGKFYHYLQTVLVYSSPIWTGNVLEDTNSSLQSPRSTKRVLSITQDWKPLRKGRVWTIEYQNRGPIIECSSHTYIVQLVVEPAGITDRIAVGISPPQGGSGGLTVRAGRARPPGCRLREGGGETGEKTKTERWRGKKKKLPKKKDAISKIAEKENINPAGLTHISRGLQKLACENK